MVEQRNDWMHVATAKSDGTQCELRFHDGLGAYELPGPYFLHDDGKWYLIEPPMLVTTRVTHYKHI